METEVRTSAQLYISAIGHGTLGTDIATGIYVPFMAPLQVIVPINTKGQFRTSSTPGIHFH
jgi:hypothetical protein